MSDSDSKKTLGLRGGPRSGQVKQSFSHGRTKNVVVETKRKRVVVPKPGTAPGVEKTAPATATRIGGPSKRPAGISDAEMERRLRALKIAKAREVEDAKIRAADEEKRDADRTRRREEAEAKERDVREHEERVRQKAEDVETKKREEEAKVLQAAEASAAPAEQKPDHRPARPRRPGGDDLNRFLFYLKWAENRRR